MAREVEDLHEKQYLLKFSDQADRRGEILSELGTDLTAYLDPLGMRGGGGFPATTKLMLTVMDLCSEVGLRYKARFNQIRPNVFDPTLRPFIDVPGHQSYPSNHSFQSFAIAFVYSRAVPEHPGNPKLFERARRVAENREWAGVHYASDTQAGHDLAKMFLPTLEIVLEDQMQLAAAEWR